MGAGGEGLRNLTRHEAADVWGVWSPDGGRVLFRSDRAGDRAFYTMLADGTDVRLVAFQ